MARKLGRCSLRGKPLLLDGKKLLRLRDNFWEVSVRERGRGMETLISWVLFSPHSKMLTGWSVS